jgi:DNA-binding NarL/FixJ family response regulator
MGFEAFAKRSLRELKATGGNAAATGDESASDLTSREAQIARLARDGLSNTEIGGRLFISPRTVEYHLRKIYTKLAISSRTELPQVI